VGLPLNNFTQFASFVHVAHTSGKTPGCASSHRAPLGSHLFEEFQNAISPIAYRPAKRHRCLLRLANGSRTKVVQPPDVNRTGMAWFSFGKGGTMFHILAVVVFAQLLASPAYPHTQRPPSGETHPGLHLMSDGEFGRFLDRLDTEAGHWRAELGNVDVDSLALEPRESDELERSYNRCLQALDNTQEEIRQLSRKQMLKLDFLLLVDLNDLARNLDALNRDLANPLSAGARSAAHKSLGYAREVLNVDVALEPMIVEFEHHVLAFAGVIDATLERARQDADQPRAQQ
jgi:hypothetical protein